MVKSEGLAACRLSSEKEFTAIFNKLLQPVGCGAVHQRGCAKLQGINNQGFDPTWPGYCTFLYFVILVILCVVFVTLS